MAPAVGAAFAVTRSGQVGETQRELGLALFQADRRQHVAGRHPFQVAVLDELVQVRDDEDLARVRAAFPGLEVVMVPDEPAIVAAERLGSAPLDAAPDSAGVRALVALAGMLMD
jgi:hypothetical protein